MLAFTTFSTQSFAQTFGLKAGVNMSKAAIMVSGNKQANSMLLGFQLGATAEIKLATKISLQSGLIFSTKGFKNEMFGTLKSNPAYLEIPINGKYALELAGQKLYISAGPYFALGIAGKNKYDSTAENIKWGNNEDSFLKRLDYGVNIGAGAEFGAIGIGLEYGFGLSNAFADGNENNYFKNKVISISVFYRFIK